MPIYHMHRTGVDESCHLVKAESEAEAIELSDRAAKVTGKGGTAEVVGEADEFELFLSSAMNGGRDVVMTREKIMRAEAEATEPYIPLLPAVEGLQ